MVALLAVPTASRANWDPAFSGAYNFILETPAIGGNARADGAVSFSVFDRTTGGLAGAGLDLVDVTARYVYAYQVTNTDPINPGGTSAEGTLVSLTIGTQVGSIRTAGNAAGFVFTDGEGTVGLPGNVSLGPVLGTTVTGVGPAYTPTGTVALGAATPGVYVPDIPAQSPLASETPGFLFMLPKAGTSSLLYFTSDTAPELVFAELSSPGGFFTLGIVAAPSPAPEPGTMALLGLGLPVVGWALRRARRTAPVA